MFMTFTFGWFNDPISDLTLRLRRPLLWSVAHPVRAAQRLWYKLTF